MAWYGYVFIRQTYDRTYLSQVKTGILTQLQDKFSKSEFKNKYKTWNNQYTIHVVKKLPYLNVESDCIDSIKEKSRLIVSYFDSDEQEYSCQFVLTDVKIDPTNW